MQSMTSACTRVSIDDELCGVPYLQARETVSDEKSLRMENLADDGRHRSGDCGTESCEGHASFDFRWCKVTLGWHLWLCRA